MNSSPQHIDHAFSLALNFSVITWPAQAVEGELPLSLWHVKAKIQDKEVITSHQRRFTTADSQLEDGRTLSDHSVQQEYTLHLMLRLCGGMQIFMRNLAAEAVPLDDMASDMIDTVKVTAQGKEGIPPYHQCLIFVGRQLGDCSTLSEYDTQKETPLHVALRLRASMQIIVKASDTIYIFVEFITLDVEASDIYDIVEANTHDKESEQFKDGRTSLAHHIQKATVQDKEGFLPYQQCLILVGRQLEDCSTFSEFDIQKEDPLHVALRLCASMQIFVKPLVCKTIAPLDGETSDAIDIFVEILTLDDEASDILTSSRPGLMLKTVTGKKDPTHHLVLRLRGGIYIFVQTLTGKDNL